MKKAFAPTLAIAFLVVNTFGLAWIATLLQRERHKLHVDHSRFRDELAVGDFVRIPFDLPLVSRDLVGKPFAWNAAAPTVDVEDPVVFEPALKGRFYWGDFDTLEFRPADGLRPGGSFTARISARLRGWDGSPLELRQCVTFNTPALALTRILHDTTSPDGSAVLALQFSDVVSPDQLPGHVTVKNARGDTLAWELVTHQAEREQRILVAANDSETLQVTVAAGIRGEGGPRGLRHDETRTVTIDRELALTELEAQISTWGAPLLQARFNRELDPQSLGDRVTVAPVRGGKNLAVRAHASGNYVNLEGELEHGAVYRVSFLPGLRSVNGQTLTAAVSRNLEIGDREGGLRFTSFNGYHFKDGALVVPIETVNLAEIEVSVLRIYPNNLVHFRNAGKPHRYNGNEYADLGRVLTTRTIRLGGARNEVRRTNLDLRDLLRDEKAASLSGATVLTVRDPNSYWARETKLVVVTDLGVVVKRSPTELLAWVASLSTTQPVAGAEVIVYSKTSQTLFTGKTEADGFVRFTAPVDPSREAPYLAVVTAGEDVTYLTLADGELSDAGFDVAGAPSVAQGYLGFAYPERGIYRPGETAHLSAIVRQVGGPNATPIDLSLPGDFPIQIRVKKPDGSAFSEATAKMSPQGIAHLDVTVPSYAPTGVYNVEILLPGHDQAIGATRFQVEDFMPNRMELKLTAAEGRLAPGGTVEIHAHGAHLFGSPAAGRTVRANCYLMDDPFEHKDWAEYQFSDATREFSTVKVPVGEHTLDENGDAVFTVQVPENLKPRGALRLDFSATLLEVGGRGVTAYLSRPMDPTPYYVGLRLAGDASVNGKAKVEIAAVTPEGKPADVASVKAVIAKLEWTYALREDTDGRLRYAYDSRAVPMREADVALANGRGEVDLDTSNWGTLRVTVAGAGTGAAASSLDFYLGSWGYQPMQGARVDRVELVPDRAKYQPGETARVTVRAPFPGKLLLFVQRERVYWTKVVDLTDTRTEVQIPMDASWAPNVYVSATVIRPLKGNDRWGAQRAYGAAPLAVDCTDQQVAVTMTTPAEIVPGAPLTVSADVKDAGGSPRVAEVIFAAVDEGILRLTNYDAPDPWGWFYGKRRMEVATSDMYGELFPEENAREAGGKSESGGGEGLQRHLNPVSVERVKSVVLWQARVPTDGSGRAQATWTVPEFDGALRVMAVAVSAARFGCSEAKVLVRRPFVVSESLPRVATCGDRFIVPVTLFNHGKSDGQAHIKVRLSSPNAGEGTAPLKVEGADTAVVALPAGSEANVRFELAASGVPGPVTVTIAGSLGDDVVEKTTELAVRPPAPLVRTSGFGSVAAGQTQTVTTAAGLFPGTGRWSVTLSSGPKLQLGEALRYLIHYPYGCVEQTTSGTLPLIHLKDLTRLIDPERFPDDTAIDAMVTAGINRLLTMQTYEGGIAFWPGEYTCYPYGSVYAAQCLLEAESAGYAVPRGCRDALLTYIRRKIVEAAECKETDRELQAYACAVLALAGDAPLGVVNRIRRSQEADRVVVRAHLARALHRAGKRAEAMEMLGPEMPAAQGNTGIAGQVVSATAENAIALDAYLEVDPESPAVPILVQRLNDAVKGNRWGTTHENALALLAIGKWAAQEAARAKASADEPLTGSLSVDGAAAQPFDPRGKNRWSGKGAGGHALTVTAAGKGRLFYYWTEEGVPTQGVAKEADVNLTVRRRYYTRDGKPLDLRAGGDTFRQGETYVAEIEVRAHRPTINVVVEDLLPAGLEIENPRIATSDWSPGETPDERDGRYAVQPVTPDHVEMRDDRLLLFLNPPTEKTGVYRYVVRAVTPGTFVLPAIAGECMYDPAVSSVSGQGKVTVKE